MADIEKYYSIPDRENNKYIKYLYSRGFLISNRPYNVHDDWTSYKFYENLYITHDARVNSVCVKNDTYFVLILGTVMDTLDWHMELKKVAEKCLSCLTAKKELMLDYIDNLGGRHLICYGDKDNQYIIQDATGMRSCFYAKNHFLAASHYNLINDIIHDDRHPYMEKYLNLEKQPGLLPGDITPYKNIMTLTPNHELHLNDMSLKRFWPRKSHDDISAETATDFIADNIHNQVITLSRYHKLMFQMTKGNDSRISLAASKPIKDRVLYYTFYSSDRSSQASDAEFCTEFAKKLGLNHITLCSDNLKLSMKDYEALCSVLYYNHYHRHVYENVFNYLEHLPKDRLNIRSNLTEIIRHTSRYRLFTNEGMDEIVEWICDYYRGSQDEYHMVKAIAKEYYLNNEYDKIFDYHFNDIYYWEYFHAIWMNCSVLSIDDINFDTYMMFNNRKILEKGLSVPRYFKNKNMVVYKAVEKMWPEVIEPFPNSDYTMSDYYNYNDANKIPIKYNCKQESNFTSDDLFLRIGKYTSTIGFGKNKVKKDDYIKLIVDFPVKSGKTYCLQIDVGANWEECQDIQTRLNIYYEISLDEDKLYRKKINSFMNKVNQINIIKYFEESGKHSITIKLYANDDVESSISGAGIIHIEGINISQVHDSKISEKSTKPIVKSTIDLLKNI